MSTPRYERAADSPEQFKEGILTRLFRGITLTAAQEAAAREVIARVTTEQSQVSLRSRAGWDQLLRLHRERDAALAALLFSGTDRAAFEANAAELLRGQEEIAAEAQVALSPNS